MHIVGMGLDATEIDRIAEVLRRHGDRFLRRIYTEGEIAYCTAAPGPVSVAGRQVRRQRGRDEGAGHGCAHKAWPGVTSRSCGEKVPRNCSFTAAPRVTSSDWARDRAW